MLLRPPAVLAAVAAALVAVAAAAEPPGEIRARRDGAADVSWREPRAAEATATVRILGINDLHGQLEPHLLHEQSVTRPVGGVAVLAAYVDSERTGRARRTLLLVAGDTIGASAPQSGLLRDEPAMAVLDALADGDCPRLGRDWAERPAPVVTRCRIVATVGNHEFDRGTAELERLLYGGRHPSGPVLGHDWGGTHVPFVAANVVRRDGQRPLLPASAIVDLDGLRIGVIGAVTSETPALVVPERVRDLVFLPEAAAINGAVAALRAAGVRTVVLVIHEGLQAPVTPQPAPHALGELDGRLARVLGALDGGVDVVVAGHTHKSQNVLVPLKDGTVALVTQAYCYGTAVSEIDLSLEVKSGAVVSKSARIVTTWADEGPGRDPDRGVARLVARATRETAPQTGRPVGTAGTTLRRGDPADPESALGDLVADAQRAAAGTELAFVNAGSLRNDIEAGPVTFGTLYAVHPFGNVLVRLTLTGAQVLRLLEQQWSGPYAETPRFLRVAGLRYVYDLGRPPGARVVAADDARGEPLDPERRYSVVANDFIAGGGDYYSVLAEGAGATPLVTDRDALEAYIRGSPGAVSAAVDGRARPFDARAPRGARPAVIDR